MKYGLVLAGGGVRGAYHIGVWRALRYMNIELSAVAGASIGAVNGALIAQGDFKTAEDMWNCIELKDIVELPKKLMDSDNILKFSNLAAIANEIRKSSGLDVAPFEEILYRVIDEDKIRRSTIDFGMTTYSISDRREMPLFLQDIPQGKLVEYIMASACFPLFKTRVIEQKKFIDGGVSNNMPVNMMTERGINNIIAVDVKGVGVYRSFNLAGRNVINIKSTHPETGTLDFDREGIRRSIEEGYIETLKAFGRCCGDEYCFKTPDYYDALGKYSKELLEGLESAASAFGINKLRIYTVSELIRAVTDAYNEFEAPADETFESILKKLNMPKNIISYLVSVLEKGGGDFIKEKLSVIGPMYDAASAILYFKRKNN